MEESETESENRKILDGEDSNQNRGAVLRGQPRASVPKPSVVGMKAGRFSPFGRGLRLCSQSGKRLLTFGAGKRGPKVSKSGGLSKVLYGELNEEILSAQAGSLQKAGYQVQTAVGRAGVLDALKHESFELVILGATLTRDDRHHLPYMAKKAHAGTRVLVMHTDGSRHPYVDGNIDTGESVEKLLEKIGGLQTKAAAATAGR